MKRRHTSRISLFLAFALFFSTLPASAFAVVEAGIDALQDTSFTHPQAIEPTQQPASELYEKELRAPVADENDDPSTALYGEPIEVHEFEKVYQTGPLSFQSVFSEIPNTYRDEKGNEHVIDNTLEEKNSLFGLGTSYLENVANSYNVKFPLVVDDRNPIEYTKDGINISLTPLGGDYSRAVADGNAVLFNNIYEDVDVQYTVRETYVKEDIILNRYVEHNTFEYRLNIDKGAYAEEHDNTVRIYRDNSDSDEPIFVLSAPCMTDSNMVVSGDVMLTLDQDGSDYIITVTADSDWLSDPARVFPVFIDPTIATGPVGSATIIEYTGRYADQGYGYVGNINATVTGVPGGNLGRARMMVEVPAWAYSSIPSEARVESAYLRMWQYGHWSSATQFMTVAPTSGWDVSTITWNDAIFLNANITGANAILPSVNGEKYFDIRDAVNNWLNGLTPNYGLMVMATNELDLGGAFFTSQSGSWKPGQGSFAPERAPHVIVNWHVPDPVSMDYPLNNTTLTLRPFVTSSVTGQLNLRGVSVDGVATPSALVLYRLNDATKDYAGLVASSYTLRYPNSAAYENAFPAGTTRYRDKLSNWQAAIPFTNFTFNDLYRFHARATNNGVNFGTERASEQFTVYQVKQFDTLPKIANHYGIPINQISFDNRIRDMLMVQGNTLFIRNPQRNANNPYNPAPLSDEDKKNIDWLLMGRGLHCEFDFEPININTGNFFMEQVDVEIENGDENFGIKRTYNSTRSRYNSLFGRGWEFEYGEAISRKQDGSITYMRGDGSVVQFEKTGDTSYEAPEGYHLTLTPIAVGTKNFVDTTGFTVVGDPWYNNYNPITTTTPYTVYEYEIVDGQGTTRRFNAFGSLVSVSNQRGEKTTLEYDANSNLRAIVSPTGLRYQIGTTADGKIDRITLPNGGTLRYTYNSVGELISYIDALGNQIRYDYDSKHRMISWYDGNGDIQIVNTYDDKDRVTEQIDALGGTSYLEYAPGKTTTTDALGNKTIYFYDDQYRTTEIRYPDGKTEINTYEDNLLVSSTDRAGNTTSYTYDHNGNITHEIRFDGAERTFIHNARSQVIREVDFDGFAIEYIYDADNNLIEVWHQGELSASFTYDTHHRKLTETNALGEITVYTYNGLNKLPATRTDALGNTTTYHFDTMQQITAVVDPLGNTERTYYDLSGGEIATEDGEGGREEYVFGAAGDVLSSINARGEVLDFSYDSFGNLLAVSDSQGVRLEMEYDYRNRKISETDGDGNTTHFEYDSQGNVTKETLPNGAIITRTFDSLGNMLTETDARGATATYMYDPRTNQIASITNEHGATTAFEYNKVGLLIRQTDSLGHTIHLEYNDKRQLVKTIEPDGLETSYIHDEAGKITTIYDNAGRVTSYEYDIAGQPVAEVDALGNRSEYQYDEAGRLVKVIDALRNETDIVSDKVARPTEIIDTLGGKTQFTYDAAGNTIKETDANGTMTEYKHDIFGYITQAINPYGATTTYEYTLGEQLEREVDPFGNATTYIYNSLRLTTGIIDSDGNITTLKYNEAGDNTKIVFANGAEYEYEYDSLGRLIREVSPEGLITEYKYDSENRIARMSDNLGTDNIYTYNEIGEIATVTDALGRIETYAYDRARNIVSVTGFDGNTTKYIYDLLGNLTSATEADGETTEYIYDALGNLVSLTDDAYRTWEYTHDALGRVTEVKNPLGQVENYEHDAVGNITAHIDQKNNRASFEYDELNNPIRQTDRRGEVIEATYDVLGRLITQTAADGGVQEFFYDKFGNIVKHQDALGNVREFNYDAVNNLTREISPNGAKTRYEHDLQGNIIKETDALGNETYLTYDAADRLTSRTLPNKGRYTYDYDVLGRVRKTTAPGELSKEYIYDARGDLVREVDQSKRTISYAYDKMHRVTSVTNPEGNRTSISYDHHGNVASILSALGAKTTFTYDPLDRVKQAVTPAGLTTLAEYDEVGNVARITQNGGRTTTFDYDEEGNLLTETNALGHTKTNTYDEVGRLTNTTNALGKTRSFNYDLKGQLLDVVNERSGKQTFIYDSVGNVTAIRDTTGRERDFTYDLLGRLIGVNEGNIETKYAYDSVGNLTSQTDGRGNATRFTYDEASRKTSQTDAIGNTQRFSYNGDGNLARLTQTDGSAITYEYNKLDELTERRADDDSGALYAFDADDRRTSMEDAHGVTDYAYDSAGRITSVTTADGDMISYSYDVFGNISSLTYPDGKSVYYLYDLLNRLTTVIDREGGVTTYRYDKADNMVGVARANGTSTTLEYDEMGAVTKLINLASDGSVISEFSYTHDLSGRIATENNTQEGRRVQRTFGYDEHGQLTAVSELEGFLLREIEYTYDEAGNRTRQTIKETGAVVEAIDYIYDDANRLLQENSSSHGATTYSYDERGNRVREWSEGQTREYDYDLENRLTAVNENGTLLFAALYDGDSNRIFTAQRNPDVTTWWNNESEEGTSTPRSSNVSAWRNFTDRVNSLISEFWYGFGQGASQICANGAHVSRMLYLNWDKIATRSHTIPVTELVADGNEVRTKRSADLADAVFIPDGVSSATRLDYELTTYVNDVNTAHTRTLAEYDQFGRNTHIYEYGAGMGYIETDEFANSYGTASMQDSYGVSALLAHTSSAGREMYAFDGRGSVANLTGTAGLAQASYRYDLFGTATVTGNTGNPYAFNAERVDRTTGLQYLRARYLDMGAGRFVGEDIYLGELSEPLSQHRFTYTLNDPLNHIDPSGHFTQCWTSNPAVWACQMWNRNLCPRHAWPGIPYAPHTTKAQVGRVGQPTNNGYVQFGGGSSNNPITPFVNPFDNRWPGIPGRKIPTLAEQAMLNNRINRHCMGDTQKASGAFKTTSGTARIMGTAVMFAFSGKLSPTQGLGLFGATANTVVGHDQLHGNETAQWLEVIATMDPVLRATLLLMPTVIIGVRVEEFMGIINGPPTVYH